MLPDEPSPRSARIIYRVVATLPDQATLADYLSWLGAGHVDAVIRAGASAGWVCRVLEPPQPLRVESVYLFPSLDSFKAYEAGAAVELRAEG